VRRVAAIEAELAGVFPDHAVDRVGAHAPALVAALAVVLQRPEQGPVDKPAGAIRAPSSIPFRPLPPSGSTPKTLKITVAVA
jgi:hypothetical protein